MKDIFGSIGALAGATAVAIVVAAVIGPPERPAPEPPQRIDPPVLVRPSRTPVGVVGRAIPSDVAEQADVKAAPWAPGVRLKRTQMAGGWEDRRALIEDLVAKDTRSYAIGDLLPHGSLLVGISTKSADILVADREIVRLADDGTLSSFEDFSVAKAPARGPRRVRDTPDYLEAVDEAVEGLRSDDPERVQAAIDALVEAGDPAADRLMAYVDSVDPVDSLEYTIPSGGERVVVPRVHGDLVIVILERITGQTYGDPTSVPAAERRALVERWIRWWGG